MDNNFTHFHIYPARRISLLLIPVFPDKLQYCIWLDSSIYIYMYLSHLGFLQNIERSFSDIGGLKPTTCKPLPQAQLTQEYFLLNHFRQLYKLRGAIQLFFFCFLGLRMDDKISVKFPHLRGSLSFQRSLRPRITEREFAGSNSFTKFSQV